MFPLFRSIAHPSKFTITRAFAAISIKEGVSFKYDAVQDLLKENARLLRVVQRRVHDRTRLRSEACVQVVSELKYAYNLFQVVRRNVVP
jgi:hypothetical protein